MKDRTSSPEHPQTDGTADGLPAVASKDWLVSFLLLCIEDSGSYSQDLERGIEDIGFHDVRSREVYRALRGMEEEGLLAIAEDGLPWKRYGITQSGRAYLEFRANLLEDHRKMTDLFLHAYERRSRGEPCG